jgi:hypothetical protein
LPYEAYVLTVGLLLSVSLALAVWGDANERGDENANWWALGTFLLLIIVLPLYLYHRAYGGTRQKAVRERTNAYTRPPTLETVTCPYCHEQVPDRKFCVSCGRPLTPATSGKMNKPGCAPSKYAGVILVLFLLLVLIVFVVLFVLPE